MKWWEMNCLGIRDVSEAFLYSMTETEFAKQLLADGYHIIHHQGRYWRETTLGFYEPLHWMARLTAKEATYPSLLSWGFRAALHDHEAAAANGSMPIHLLSDIKNYELKSLPQKRRTDLRKCLRQVKIVQLTSPALLEEQGYEVLCSSLKRTNHQKLPSREKYLVNIRKYFNTEKHYLLLAGMIGEKLGGYIDGYAVDGTAYMTIGYYAAEALLTSIVTGLNFEFVQICRRSGGIYQVVDGLHLREVPSLDAPKASMGFPVKHIPTKVSINPIMKQLIRWRYPHKYYRMIGKNQ